MYRHICDPGVHGADYIMRMQFLQISFSFTVVYRLKHKRKLMTITMASLTR